MSDFALAIEETEEVIQTAVEISKMENGVEERRLLHEKIIMGFRLRSPKLTKAQAQAYVDFYTAHYGEYSEFTFTSFLDDTEYTVRFSGPMVRKQSNGNFWCEWEFERC